MGEFTTIVGVDLIPPKPERDDHKCVMCGFTGNRQDRYDHEVECLERTQQVVKEAIKQEKLAMRMQAGMAGGKPR